MKNQNPHFDEHTVLHKLKHYLPAQAPLKDFIHHNTLHAFQDLKFHEGLHNASEIFGYKVYLGLNEFRSYYSSGRINHAVVENVIIKKKGQRDVDHWLDKLLVKEYNCSGTPRIGLLRANWKEHYHLNLDSLVHPILFRILASYLDQGISIWNFPVHHRGFLASIREIEKNSFTSFFKTKRAKDLLLTGNTDLNGLLKLVVGDEELYERYLFDQQFAHQGWAGMVASVDDNPSTLLDKKNITFKELVILELLLEIDALDNKLGNKWEPIAHIAENKPADLFSKVPDTELFEVFSLWQEAFEWSYYDQVLAGLKIKDHKPANDQEKSFQSMFCIDDRELSLRRYLENFDPACETFATPGFFGVEFYFKPDQGKFYTKLCPAPVNPKYLIKEIGKKNKRELDPHFAKRSHSLIWGYLISQTLGFWSALRLFINVFRPSMSPATASSFRQMDKHSQLTIENKDLTDRENDLQVGFTVTEMADRVEGVLKSIGIVKDFAPIVYAIGHGSSSVNNPHYAAYDCGACCGRPGSVNARVFSFMANHPEVIKILASRGLVIPYKTQFLGGLHDTSRDEIMFFDEDSLTPENLKLHLKNEAVFKKALDYNAKERSRRFESVNTSLTPQQIHKKVKQRSVSLFEPRPELNHATNALCIIGKRELTKGLFMDRRAFMNSFDYEVDPEGKYLLNILKAAAPVCGGINLEYFFSRVDNQRLGAGTKLPHNVLGLFGVANGIDGDLRPGLPSQMIEVHDPVRLLIIIEHLPGVVLETIKKSPETYEWFINEWIYLVVFDPEKRELFLFDKGEFISYEPVITKIGRVADLMPVIESEEENLPVYLIA